MRFLAFRLSAIGILAVRGALLRFRGGKHLCHVARDVQTGGLHALRKVEQLVEAVAFVLPEVGIHQNE